METNIEIEMKTSEILKTLVLLICTYIFISCQKEDEGRKITGYEEYTITIASEKECRACYFHPERITYRKYMR